MHGFGLDVSAGTHKRLIATMGNFESTHEAEVPLTERGSGSVAPVAISHPAPGTTARQRKPGQSFFDHRRKREATADYGLPLPLRQDRHVARSVIGQRSSVSAISENVSCRA